jgi:hypothetical protein
MLMVLLPMVAIALVVGASGPAPDRAARDRDHDGLPDRWERRYDLSTSKKSAKGDPDRDGLRNRREYRLRTNPRKRDTDGDGHRDRAELRAGTNPRDRASRPSSKGKGSQFPNRETTGVPDGWAPRQTRASDLTVSRPGTVVQDIRFTNASDIIVKAKNVTIRRVEMQGGSITNQYGSAPANCGHDLLVEDATFGQVPGRFAASDYPVIGEGSYTARRIEVDGRGEGPRLSDCGPVTLEDSFIKIHGADPGTPACDEVHSDGVQAVAGVGASARNNTVIMETSCGTSPWFVVNPSVNKGRYDIDRLLVAGGGYTFRQQVASSVTGLRIVNNSWVYGPLGEMDCSVISPWEAKIVRVDASYRITRVVRNQRCTGD